MFTAVQAAKKTLRASFSWLGSFTAVQAAKKDWLDKKTVSV